MFNPNSGAYFLDDDRPYEFETNYYLHFQIVSALMSTNFLTDPQNEMLAVFENKAQYYHYYLDHLLYSMGQISERFRTVSKPKSDKIDFNERREKNRKHYDFNESIYPILSNKDYRNTIEHIDEYNINTIITQKGVGGFNYIDMETPEALRQTLLSNRHNHIYTLDLLSGNVYITRNKAEIKTGNDSELSFSINELRIELAHLFGKVKWIDEMLSETT